MRRLFRWLKALFNRSMDKLEDPEIMLDQARRDMQQGLLSNREKAVQAITQKNRLQGMLEETLRKSSQLENQAAMALKTGNRDLARQFLREKATNDSTIETLRATHAQAVETVESVKIAIKRQEEQVRRKLAESLAMKAQWKQAQIQNSIAKALDGLTFENQFASFGVAAERIKDAQSEAAARNEMLAGSVQGKMMAMEDQSMDMAAEDELQKLEEKLGKGAPSTANVAGADGLRQDATSEVDQQLADLEKRLQQGT